MHRPTYTTLVVALLIVGCQPIAAARYSSSRAIVNEAVKDPGSTEFRNEQLSSSGTYCAEVNSKNSYGAFVGFQRVMAKPDVLEGKSYVFFERDGLESDGVNGAIIQAKLLTATLGAKNDALEREVFGGNKATLSEKEYQIIAGLSRFEWRLPLSGGWAPARRLPSQGRAGGLCLPGVAHP